LYGDGDSNIGDNCYIALIRVYDQWVMDFPIVLIGMRRFEIVACYMSSWWHAKMAHPMR
jgi:hypothetical protein